MMLLLSKYNKYNPNKFNYLFLFNINNTNKHVLYRNYYCKSYEKNLKEKQLLEKINSQDKEKIYLINLLKKIESQNEILISSIKKLNDKITNFEKK